MEERDKKIVSKLEKLMAHDDWDRPSSISSKTEQIQSLAGNGKTILDNLLFVYV